MLVESGADSKGNSLSSSISGFHTKDTKPADSGPKSEPEETMKIFRHGANGRSITDRMFRGQGQQCQAGTNKPDQPCGTVSVPGL